MNDLAELTCSYSGGGKELELVEATVLHEHDRSLSLLVGAHESVELIDAVSAANLKSNDLALSHSLDSNLNVILPRASNVNRVYIIRVQNIMVIKSAENLISILFLAFPI